MAEPQTSATPPPAPPPAPLPSPPPEGPATNRRARLGWILLVIVAAATVGFQNPAMLADQRFQAAASYSLTSPPKIGRRRIPPSIGSGTSSLGRGGCNRSARCGRAVL